MAEKKYLDYDGVSNLVSKIRAGFANKTHTHSKSEIDDFPTIPSKTSELVNDSGFKTTDNNTTYDLSASTSSANGNVKINLSAGGSGSGTDEVSIIGAGATTVTTDSSGVVKIQSTNTTYGAAGSSLGLVKSGGDVSISNGTITVNNAANATKATSLAAVATSGTGAAYTATVDGITELVAGVNFIMLPHVQSTTTSPTLNVNGLGAKALRQQLSNSTSSTTSAANANWLGANKPVRVMYNGIFWAADLVRPTASSIYGVVPIENGGTGANNAEDARINLGITTRGGTTTSGNADYAEVGEWADGNPNDENRIGYFVAIDNTTAGTTMVKATSTSDVRGVTVARPAFSGNCSPDKFETKTVTETDPVTGEEIVIVTSTDLLKQYDYVGVMGLVPVIDDGTCVINGRCMPNDDGIAVPIDSTVGYQVIDRIDDNHILIAVEPSADMLVRIKEDVTELQSGKADTSALEVHTSNQTVHITNAERTLWNSKASSTHNQASNTINAMTGYTKPSSTSAIAESDTLNAAIGKLEKALDGKTSTVHSQSSDTINKMTGYTKPSSTSAIATSDTLNTAIGKLEKALDNKAASSHNQASDTINKMTGYTKPSSTSAIATSDTLNTAIGKLEKGLDVTSGKVTTLIGTDTDKSVRAIANEELATQLIPDNAKESLDTLQEIASWIQQHPDDVATMNAEINKKANASDLTSHTDNATVHITAAERTKWNDAKTHADSAHAPSNAEANQNAFSNIKVGGTTVAADTKTDTLELAGNNVTITPDAASDKVTIGITKANVTDALGYTPPTTNTTYGTGTASTAGITKLYTDTGTATDGTMTQNAITAKLDSKSDKTHTHNYAGSSSAGGSATSANKLATARTIGIDTGAVGTATSFDGSANITIPITAVKESYLSWGGKNVVGDITPIGMACSNEHNTNRLAFINGNALTFEYSSDGGSTWTDYGYSASAKSSFCTKSLNVPVGRASGSTAYTTSCKTRVTLSAQSYVYTNPKKMLINISSSGGMNVLIEYKTGASNAAWQTFGTYSLSGWSGWNDIPLILGTLGGGADQTGNIWFLRLTFSMTSVNSGSPNMAQVNSIRLFGTNCWTSASAVNNKGVMSETGHLYSYDINANAAFPAGVTATTFTGTLSGNASTATKLTSSAGSETQPVYFSDGKPVATTYTLNKTVPSDAKFTDTVYTHPTTSGNKHIPSGGSSGQILRWSADGTAVWGPDNNTTYSTGTASTAGITKLYTGTGTATDGTMTQNAIKSALDGKVDKTQAGVNAAINLLSTGDSTPTDNDYFISQYVNGGTTTTTYHRRPISALYTYMKNKFDSIYSASGHTHNYAGSSSAGGSATSAVKLDTSNGSPTEPIYFSEGKPVKTAYALNKTVPADAVFTDTKNTAGSTDTSSRIYLVGATSQAANPQTYSDNEVYATSGVLTTKSVQVGGGAATIQYDSTNKCINFVFA